MNRYLQCWKRKESTQTGDIKGAGVIFTDGNLILAGYQPNKRKPFVSGIGGRKEEGETYWETAIREMVEEIFELKTIPKELCKNIQSSIQPKKTIIKNGYANLHYSFEDLYTIMQLLKKYDMQSEVYEPMPTNLLELLFQRQCKDKKVEISHLCLLPVVKHTIENPFVDILFIEDMRNI